MLQKGGTTTGSSVQLSQVSHSLSETPISSIDSTLLLQYMQITEPINPALPVQVRILRSPDAEPDHFSLFAGGKLRLLYIIRFGLWQHNPSRPAAIRQPKVNWRNGRHEIKEAGGVLAGSGFVREAQDPARAIHNTITYRQLYATYDSNEIRGLGGEDRC